MTASSGISSRTAPPESKARKRNAGSSSSTAERFRLTGRSVVLDARTHAYRRDLADIALAGQLFAPHYAAPVTRVAGPDARAVLAAPADDAEQVCELRSGDEFAVLDVTGSWAWGYRCSDHHVGYVRDEHLS